jgi:hypothetical protein
MTINLLRENSFQNRYSLWRTYFHVDFVKETNAKSGYSALWLPTSEAIFFSVIKEFLGRDVRFIASRIFEIFNSKSVKQIILHYDRILCRINSLIYFNKNEIEELDVTTLHFIIIRYRNIMKTYGFHITNTNNINIMKKKNIANSIYLFYKNLDRIKMKKYMVNMKILESFSHVKNQTLTTQTNTSIKTCDCSLKVTLYLEPFDEKTRLLALSYSIISFYKCKTYKKLGLFKIFQLIQKQYNIYIKQRIKNNKSLMIVGSPNDKINNNLSIFRSIIEIKSCHCEGLIIGHIFYLFGAIHLKKIHLKYNWNFIRNGFSKKEFEFMKNLGISLPPV